VVPGSLWEKPVKIGTKVVSPGAASGSDGRWARYLDGRTFKEIVMLIAPSCGGHLRQARREMGQIRQTTTAEERFDERKATSSSADNPAI
jgi:hypothetical protein